MAPTGMIDAQGRSPGDRTEAPRDPDPPPDAQGEVKGVGREPASGTPAGGTAPADGNTAQAGWWHWAKLLTATSAFRQASAYVAAVMVVGAALTWIQFQLTTDTASRQLIETISTEIDGFADLARAAGQGSVVDAVERRSAAFRTNPTEARPLYLIENAAGEKLAGNLKGWPEAFNRQSNGGTFQYTAVGEGESPRLAAGVVRALPGGLRVLAARDLGAQERLARQLRWLFLVGFGTLALVGIAAGALASRLALGRISQITRTSDAIMAGNLSGRIPISGNQDELDDLARNLNVMLDRIEQLMAGLREVSDNIAHDLKTPLTRLRTRAEAALRESGGASRYREGLEHVIEDADELIKTFNALLLIARLEAGALEGASETFDVAALVEDVADLYGPVAEEAGLRLECAAAGPAPIRANRHLVGQAIANLIDNAIKYGRPANGQAGIGDTSAPGSGINVEVKRDGDFAVVTVSDHGPGIAVADRERVLKRFVRLEASRTRPGTGLGLSLVSAVARLTGGRVALEDNHPGLKIELHLPVSG